jgi:hypothetical protein
MMIRKIVAGTVIAGAIGAGGMALAGTASADAQNWTPGKGGWQPGAAIATFNNNVSTSIANGNKVLSQNSLLNGNFNGLTFNVASGNTVKVPVLNGNKVNVLNGAFSNNILNSGADSFNTSKTVIKNSYNKLVDDGHKYGPKKPS